MHYYVVTFKDHKGRKVKQYECAKSVLECAQMLDKCKDYYVEVYSIENVDDRFN